MEPAGNLEHPMTPTIRATSTKGPITATSIVDLCEQLEDLQPSGLTVAGFDVPAPTGDETLDWLHALRGALVGEHVEAGGIAQNYDHGRVLEVTTTGVLVAWQRAGAPVRVALAGLREYSAATDARTAAELRAAAGDE